MYTDTRVKGKPMKTDITVILDKSGSMHSIKDDTIGGFNQFINEQKNQEGKATLTLVQFNTSTEVTIESQDINDIEELTSESFIAMGGTALLDAVGNTIQNTKVRISKQEAKDKPDKVVFVIITDGGENSSFEYTKDLIQKVVKEAEERGWGFIYLGADQNEFDEARRLGINVTAVSGYNKGNMLDAYGSISGKISTLRSASMDKPVIDSIGYTEEERTALKTKS